MAIKNDKRLFFVPVNGIGSVFGQIYPKTGAISAGNEVSARNLRCARGHCCRRMRPAVDLPRRAAMSGVAGFAAVRDAVQRRP
jgi:uncharacterized protein YceK